MTETELLKVQLTIALEALTRLASWEEGAEVDNSFDSPHTAKTARLAISDMTRARTLPHEFSLYKQGLPSEVSAPKTTERGSET